jgi:hypothetical protein
MCFVVLAALPSACSQSTADSNPDPTASTGNGAGTPGASGAGTGSSVSTTGSSTSTAGGPTSTTGGPTTTTASAGSGGGASASGVTSGNGGSVAANSTTSGSGGASTTVATSTSSGQGGGTSVGSTSGAGGSTTLEPFKGVANSPCAARTALNVSWYYNWEQTETEPCTGGQGGEFVPMIWGHTGNEQNASKIQSTVASFVSSGKKYVLGFNEHDNTGQSNISVATAITLLPSFDNPSILVGTPASQANASGQTWFKDYMSQVNASTTLRADFIAIHWYGWNAGSCDAKASQLESYIKYAEGFAGNRPIWLTEWGCLNDSAPTADGVVAFYKGAVAVFARHPRVQRYAWYPWSTNCELNNDDGTLTSLGVAYAAAAEYQ